MIKVVDKSNTYNGFNVNILFIINRWLIMSPMKFIS